MIFNKPLMQHSVHKNVSVLQINKSLLGNHWEGFVLETGEVLSELPLAYHTYGELNEKANNVVWVFHALTANSDALDWWEGLIGTDKLIDPAKYFIVCVNMPGSCYGSISPLTINPKTGEPYYLDFPVFTTRDMIRSYQYLREYLGIQKIHLGIGGSMGGQQLLEWAIEEPNLFEHIVPMATNAFHSPWGIAFNTSQRMAIEADSTWGEKDSQAGEKGLKAARSMALLSYRNYEAYALRQSEEQTQIPEQYKASSYQYYQGEKLTKRFNAYSYYMLTQSMDRHHLGRGRESVEWALQQIKAKAWIVGISSDILFPLKEQIFLRDHINDASFEVIHSNFGHDGFLIEFKQLEEILIRTGIFNRNFE